MKPGNNIEESVKRLRCTSSAETDERIVGDALAALRESAQLRQPAAGKRVVAVVAAVVVIAAIFIVVGIFTSPVPKQPQDLTQELASSPEAVVPPPRFASRDAEAGETVRKAEGELGAKSGVKPVVEKSVDSTLRQSTVQAGSPQEEKSAARREGYVRGWLIDADNNPVQGEIQLGESKAQTKADGAFAIREPNYTGTGSVIGRAFDASGNLGCLFIRDKDDDINDVGIIVEPLAAVKGYVVDEDANAVGNFELKISVSGYQGSIGEEPWRSKIEPNGSFEVNSIPAGVPLQLAVEKAGFDKVLIELADLAAGKGLDVGQVRLKPLPDFNEGGKPLTLLGYGEEGWNYSLAGFVVDESNEPLAGARISLTADGRNFEAATDANGWYEVHGLPSDTQMDVNVYFDGYGSNLFNYNSSEPNGHLDMQIFQPASENP